MPKVRLTIRPDEEIEVPEHELVDLTNQGLVVGTEEANRRNRELYGFDDEQDNDKPRGARRGKE